MQRPKIIGLIAIVFIATAGTGAVVALSKKTETAQVATTTTNTDSTSAQTSSGSDSTESATPTTEPTTANVPSTTYANGTYSATGSYITPDGGEDIGVTLTISNDTVTGASLSGLSSRGETAEYQERFASGYKLYVIGKAIDSISLSRVSGSSLTSTGFNRALSTIKAQAQA